jgi:hypothetical protein
MAVVARAYARAGRRQEAQATLKMLLNWRAAKTRYVSAYAIAWIYVGLRDKDAALEWLSRAHDEQGWDVAFVGVEPALASFRSDARFAKLTTR